MIDYEGRWSTFAVLCRRRILPAGAIVSASLALYWPQHASADPLRLTSGLQERYSDNVRLTHNHTKSDLMSRAYIGFSQHADPGVCNSDLSGELGYKTYLQNTYSDQSDVSLNWDGNCQVTDGLYWTVSDHASEVPRNSTQPNTPDNTTRRNYFSTGPRYTWRITPRDTMSFTGLYTNTRYSSSQNNSSHGTKGDVSYRRQLDPTLAAGLSGEVTDTKYDNKDEEINIRSLSLTFDKQFPETHISGSAGYQTLDDKLNGNTSTSSGVIWNGRIDRTITETSSWYFMIARNYTTTSSDYPIVIAGLLFNYQDTSAVRVTSYSTGYDNTWSSGTVLNVNLFRHESDYLLNHNTDVDNGISTKITQGITERMTGDLTLGYTRQKSDRAGTTNNTVDTAAGISYQRTKALSVSFRVGHNLRHSNVTTDQYAENWALIGLQYRFM